MLLLSRLAITTAALAALAATALLPASASAQAASVASAAPEVGALAPDFAIPGATRYGLLRDPVHLADYKGKTVVLAFFFRAFTKG